MQLEIIGTSGAFAPGTNVSMIIWPQDTKQNGILLDCGFSVFQKVQQRSLHPQSPALGEKNSSVGNSMRRNSSQGLSEELSHSFSGTQKS